MDWINFLAATGAWFYIGITLHIIIRLVMWLLGIKIPKT